MIIRIWQQHKYAGIVDHHRFNLLCHHANPNMTINKVHINSKLCFISILEYIKRLEFQFKNYNKYYSVSLYKLHFLHANYISLPKLQFWTNWGWQPWKCLSLSPLRFWGFFLIMMDSFMPLGLQSFSVATILALSQSGSQSITWFSLTTWAVMAVLCLSISEAFLFPLVKGIPSPIFSTSSLFSRDEGRHFLSHLHDDLLPDPCLASAAAGEGGWGWQSTIPTCSLRLHICNVISLMKKFWSVLENSEVKH